MNAIASQDIRLGKMVSNTSNFPSRVPSLLTGVIHQLIALFPGASRSI
jgi:hypothetical protein